MEPQLRKERRQIPAHPTDVAMFYAMADAIGKPPGYLFSMMLEHFKSCQEVAYDWSEIRPQDVRKVRRVNALAKCST